MFTPEIVKKVAKNDSTGLAVLRVLAQILLHSCRLIKVDAYTASNQIQCSP
jgi:hypothetical protein